MKRYPATASLILMNGLVFAAMALHLQNVLFNRSEDFLFMLASGANFNPYTVGGEYWRLLTSMFMHWGIVHLAVNMFALYSIGRTLEIFLGPWKFLLLYLITGLASGLSSLFFNVYVVSAGASGAIFGLFGYMILLQILANFHNRKALGAIAFNFIIFVAVNYAIARQFNVDTAGHLGGFVSGAALLLINYGGTFNSASHQVILLLAIPFVVLLVPEHQLRYYQVYSNVIRAEEHLRSVYDQLLTDHQRGDSLQQILPEFESALDRLNQLPAVPHELAGDTAVMKRYTSYRLQEVNYRLLGIELESYAYLDSVEVINAKLDSLPALKYRLNYKPAYPRGQQEQNAATAIAEWIKVYYDSGWREIDGEAGAHYYRLGRRDTMQRWQGDVRDYYINGRIQMKGSYLDGMHHGVFRYYSRQGKYESMGRYDKETPVGKWQNFYPNGRLESEVFYGDRSFTKSVYDPSGNLQVANGEGKQTTWHENGRIREEGNFIEGRKEGNWYGYYPSGKPHYQEFYRKGVLIRGVAESESGERFVYDQLSVFPFPKIGMPAYNEYLQKSLRRPTDPSLHQGTVEVTFLVDLDGTTRDFVITGSVCPACDLEAIRLIKEGPEWRPGVLRGHIRMRSNGYVQVHF